MIVSFILTLIFVYLLGGLVLECSLTVRCVSPRWPSVRVFAHSAEGRWFRSPVGSGQRLCWHTLLPSLVFTISWLSQDWMV